jgi:predicted CXXCH cytochrome family protein
MSRRAWPLLLALAHVLGWTSWAPPSAAQLLSPGPLSAPHAGLEGDDKCNRCHTSGRGTSNALCTGCHANIADAVSRGRGLHGGPFRGQACSGCHTEHRGRGSPLIRFDSKSFDHGQTGWKLGGAHAKATCKSCHKSRSWIGLSRTCTSCHSDPHQNRFGRGA